MKLIKIVKIDNNDIHLIENEIILELNAAGRGFISVETTEIYN